MKQKRFRSIEGRKIASHTKHIALIGALTLILVLIGSGVVSATPDITSWSNTKTGDDDIMFLVNQGETITFSVSPIGTYEWQLNKNVQSATGNSFTWTVPDEKGIWEIHVTDGSDHVEWVISTLSIDEAPDIFDYFADKKYRDRTETDPWGRTLPEWQDDTSGGDVSKTFIGGDEFHKHISSDVAYGTWLFKFQCPNGLLMTGGGSTYFEYYYFESSSGGIGDSMTYEGATDSHHHAIWRHNIDGTEVIAMCMHRDASNYVTKNWATAKIIRTPDGYVYTFLDDYAESRWPALEAIDIANIITIRKGGPYGPPINIIRMDNVEAYKDRYLFPEKSARNEEYITNWMYNGEGWWEGGNWNPIYRPVKKEGVVIQGRGVRLKEIANMLGNPSIFSYDDETKTAVCHTNLAIADAAELIIEDETLKIYSSTPGEHEFAVMSGSTLQVKNSIITSGDDNYFVWRFTSTTHLGFTASMVPPEQDDKSPILFGLSYMSLQTVIIENSTINNSTYMFFDSPHELRITDTTITNLHEVDAGEYSAHESETTRRKEFVRGEKGLWVLYKNSELLDFDIRNVTISSTESPLSITFMMANQWEKLNIYDMDLGNENIEVRHSCQMDSFWYPNTEHYNSALGVVNCRFNQLVVPTDYAWAVPKYYLDVKVIDGSENPVPGATVSVTNEVDDTNYPAENMVKRRPIVSYDGHQFFSFTPLHNTVTGSNGYTPLPSDREHTIVIADYVKDNNGIQNFTYTVTASKGGKTASMPNLDIDESWYRKDPNTPTKTVICNIDNGECWVEGVTTGTISGTVKDKDTSNTLEGATVSDGIRSATTNESGGYTIQNVPIGSYTVTASADGYESASEDNINVSVNQTTMVHFELNPVGDIFPPTTTSTITPTPNEAGWNNVTPVVVTFFRSDSHSGVSYTNYSKTSETGPWTTVDITTATGPDAGNVTDISEGKFNVTVSDDGVTTIWYYSVDTNSNVEITKNVTVKIDTLAPIIYSNVTATNITGSSATITWTTDEPATSQVEYGTTPSYGSSTPIDTNFVTKHSTTLTGLTENTTYHYRVKSFDEADNEVVTQSYNFTTPAISSIVYVATDGTGDYNCDGTDDHIEINQAISYINSIGSGIVHLKAGTYIINDTINLCSNLIFEGEDEDKTIIKLKDQNNREFWALFNCNDISNTTIQNFTLDGNKYNNPVPNGINSDVDGFHIYNSDHITFQYVTCEYFWSDPFEFSHSNDSVVRNCEVIQAGHDGMRTIYGQRITFSNNYVHADGTGNTGVRIYTSSDCVVENNTFNVYGMGIEIQVQSTVTCGNNIYRDNYMEGHDRCSGIWIQAWDGIIDNETFLRNIVASADGHGIEFETIDAGKIQNVKLINNVFNKAKSGIYATPGSDVANIIAKNNIIVNNREYGIYGNVISSYNDVWENTNGNYGGGVSHGTGDISINPLFADTENGDFHLKSTAGRWNGSDWVYSDTVTSQCIDAGVPYEEDPVWGDYRREKEPNGGRINIGAYGNTGEASKSGGPDTTPPTAFIDSIAPDPAEQGKDTVSFTGHGTDKDGFVNAYNWRSSIDGQLSTASTFSKPASELSAGTHTIYFRVQDDDGAWSPEVAEDLTITDPGNQPPVADPNGPYTGTEGIPLTLDGLGSYDPDGSIVSYEWYFGDESTGTGVNPQHTYAQDGAYTVTLTVTDNNGAIDTDTTTATIADTKPTADFTATPTSGPEPLTVTFIDTSSSYDGITAWEWDFDNDSVIDSTAQNPTHEYAEAGKYTVSLTVSEADGDRDTETKADYITVTEGNQTEYIWLEAEDAGTTTPDFVIVNDTSASNGRYIWIPEGTGWNPGKGEATYNIHINRSGDYVIWGRVIAPNSSDNSFFVQLDDGFEALWTIALSANWQWDAVNHWGTGEEFNPEIDPVVFNLSPGEHILRIKQREDGTKLDKLLITNSMSYVPADIEENQPPTAFINSISPDHAEQGKDTVSFTGHGTDTDGVVTAYNWRSSIDGKLSTASTFSKPASELAVGTHTIYFRVQDDDGAWSTEAAEDVTIAEPGNQPPVADPNGPYTGTEGILLTLDGSSSYDLDGIIVSYETLDSSSSYDLDGIYDLDDIIFSYEWDFGDASSGTGVNPQHTYAQDGAYTVTLTVTDNGGATNTNTTTATIADTEPIADFTGSSTSGPEPLTVTFTDTSTSYDGISVWEWDFDNDNVIDSTDQNPTYMYAKDGVYTVTLKVYESDGDHNTETKVNYITVTKANSPPYKPGSPLPFDGATDVPVDTSLSWTGGDPDTEDTVTYNVYFGTESSPPLVSENQPENTYDPGMLKNSTKYYWRIVASDNHGDSNGSDIWKFTTTTAPDTLEWWGYYLGAGEGTWGRTGSEAHSGNYSAFLKEIAYESSDWINIGLIAGKSDGYTGPDAYTAIPSTTYNLSFWLKGDFTRIGVYAMTWNTEEGTGGRSGVPTTLGWIIPTDSWTKYEGTFTTPADAKKFVVMFKAYGYSMEANLGTIYVDDVDVNIGEGNIIINPGAENTEDNGTWLYTQTQENNCDTSGCTNTVHFNCTGIECNPASDATLTIHLKGDYNHGNEYARIYVDGNHIGDVGGFGKDGLCGSDHCNSYDSMSFTISKPTLEDYLSDGTVTVMFADARAVNYCCNAAHKAELEFGYGT